MCVLEDRRLAMKKKSSKYLKLVALAATLPFIYGCGAGTGVGTLIGFLFGGGGLGGGEIALLGASASGLGAVGSGAGLATLHQPEPASMMLLGSGLMAMGYFKSKKSRSSK